MKLLTIYIITIFFIISSFNYHNSDSTKFENIEVPPLSISKNSNQIQKAKISISNPLEIEYEYSKIVKLEDGSSANAFVEKGKKDNKDGDYVWSKMIPFYASAEVKFVFEYQMNFTLSDLEALGKWLEKHIGENVKAKSIDNPSWYKEDMTLGSIFKYCRNNNKNITMGYYSDSLKRMALVIFDSGSTKTNTSSEIGLVYFIYNTK
jgi:hypothetical protein